MFVKPLDSPGVLDPSAFQTAELAGLYVHIPFCFHKCHYCDFYSITRQTPERMERFVDLTLAEAGIWSRRREGPSIRPKTIFFGGGTPSLLPLGAMCRLVRGLREIFDLSRCSEWTSEANPATVTEEYCSMFKSEGVDRLSFGAQSFDAAQLKVLERHHEPDDVPRSLQLARAAGFKRLNIDVIYAIPGQSLDSWRATLEAGIALQTPHLSCYGLTYESNTPLAVRKRLGQVAAAEESLELKMFHHTRARLAQIGKPAYEISNYAIPGEECRHNLLYWNGGNYLGIGPAAASHADGWRWRNRPHLGEWESCIESGELPAAEIEHLSPRHRAGELAMLQLRLAGGLRYADFSDRSGYDARELFSEQIARLGAIGLLRASDEGIALGDRGLEVADAIAGEFLATVA